MPEEKQLIVLATWEQQGHTVALEAESWEVARAAFVRGLEVLVPAVIEKVDREKAQAAEDQKE